jgi:cupin fold WbuC family metalloprotein
MTGMPNPIERLRMVSPEVYYSDGSFLASDGRIIDLLKDGATRSPRRRCRLCFHAGPEAPQQEMLIVMHKGSYVRPHRHFGKVETLTVVEGQCDALLFDEGGNVSETIPMAPPPQPFFYRMPERLFHTLIFRSEWLVFLETTIGPFDPGRTEQATWAPAETDPEAGNAWLSTVTAR